MFGPKLKQTLAWKKLLVMPAALALLGCGGADQPPATEPTTAAQVEPAAGKQAEMSAALDSGTLVAQAEAAKPVAVPAPAADPLELPAERTPESLEAYFERVVNLRPEGNDNEEIIAWVIKQQNALVTAADALLALPDLTQDYKLLGIEVKDNALQTLRRASAPNAEANFIAFHEALAKDSDPELSMLGRVNLLGLRASNAIQAEGEGEEEALAVTQELIALAQEKPEDHNRAQLMMQFATAFEQTGKYQAALQVLDHIVTNYSEVADPTFQSSIFQLATNAHKRLGLIGNTMQIEGTMLDGERFDWSKYQGKVVLVDFWATWCPPCVAEIPGLIENYKKYNDKGFEIVGISLDSTKEDVLKFYQDRNIPWVTIYDEDAPMAERYGINALPAPILLGQDGKVITLSARGDDLGQHLARLLGPAETPAVEAPVSEIPASEAPAAE